MRRLVLLSLAALISAAAMASGQDPKDEVRDLLNQGAELYKRGKLDEAFETFEKAISKMPQSPLVYAWLERTGVDLIYSMLNETDTRLQDLGRRLLELAKPSVSFKADPAKVKEAIEDLKSSEWNKHQAAMFHLVHYGPYAVKYLIPILNDPAQDRLRARVKIALKLMGTQATLGVAEALNSEREYWKLLRQEACIVLGNIGDERAIPALKALYEDANEYPEVRREAHIALAKLTNKTSDAEWKKATDYYFELAQKYYYGHPDVIRGWERAFLFWKWDEKGNKDPQKDPKEGDQEVLTEREIPQFAYNEQLAEEALLDMLTLDPEYEPAWALLMMTYAAQVIEATASIRAAEEAKELEEVKEEEVSYMKELLGSFNRLNVLAEMVGRKHVYQGIERAMKDGSPQVAQVLLHVAREKGKVEDLPPPVYTGVEAEPPKGNEVAQPPAKEQFIGYPVVDALTYFDKRVRYAASEAMLKIAPREKRLGWELVIPNLADALGEEKIRVALVIYDVKSQDDYQVINHLRKTLESINVFPVIAKSAGEGLTKARDFPTEDIILIQYKVASMLYVRESVAPGKTLVNESVMDALRDDVRTRHIPKYIIAESDDEKTKAEEIYMSHMQKVIRPDIDRHLLMRHFNEDLEFERARNDAKSRADEMARHSAIALSQLAVETTIYPYRDAVPALIGAAKVRDNLRERDIRIPAIVALGHFGDDRAVDPLIDVVNFKPGDDTGNEFEKPVRLAASKALSQIFWHTKYVPSDDQVLKLTSDKAIDDGDYDIELAVGEALGNSNLTNARRVALEHLKRKSSFRSRLGMTAEEIEQKAKE